MFTNEQLAAMSRTRPQTAGDLMKLEGIGKGKMDKFGEPFLKQISEIVSEADRPSV